MRPLSLLILAALWMIPALPTCAQQKPADEPPTLVDLDAVRSEPLVQTTPVLGRLIARHSGPVAARTNGPLSAFLVQVGDRVEAGQVIAVLDVERARLQVDLHKAEVAQAEAAKRTSQVRASLLAQELKRLENLRNSAAFSQARRDDKQREYEAALAATAESEANVARSRAVLTSAEVNIRDSEIRAPYAGVITERHTELGAWVKTGDAVVSLVDDRQLEIQVDVPSNRVDGLVPGRQVRFDIGPLTDITAEVRAVIPQENPLTRTRSVRLIPQFAEADRVGLATDQSLTLHVPVGASREVTTVHKDAVVQQQGRNFVYLMVAGKAERRAVQLGDAAETRFVVKSGLEPGELVVIRGNERLRDGQPLRAADAPQPKS
ncbi:efflux RND transporter periplasmic adaptor subunit [Magnetospira thiophila]